jgi:hypothetical protein
MDRRICVICIEGLGPGLASRQPELWLGGLAGGVRSLRPTFPAVAPSIQASMTTGVAPGVHGIISGGLYRRQKRELSFRERSNTLLNKKRFWHSRRLPRRLTAAMVFWPHALAGAAEVVVGSSTYAACEEVAAQPTGLCEQLRAELGPPDESLWRGPRASWRGAKWIAAAAEWVWRNCPCDLHWVNLPGLEPELVRHGPDSPQAAEAVRGLDALAAKLAEAVAADGGETIIVSSGALRPVERAALPNARLVEAGLLALADTPLGPLPDLARSRAWAMVDHQVAQLYCDGESSADAAAEALGDLPGVAAVVTRDELFEPGLGHDRAGERVVLAEPDAWLALPWWGEAGDAPLLGEGLGAHFGFDPCDMLRPLPGRQCEPHRVRASQGLADPPAEHQCLLAATCDLPEPPTGCITDLPELVKSLLGLRNAECGMRITD